MIKLAFILLFGFSSLFFIVFLGYYIFGMFVIRLLAELLAIKPSETTNSSKSLGRSHKDLGEDMCFDSFKNVF